MIVELVSIKPSPRKAKKLVATFNVNGKVVKTHFGAAGMSDFTKHKDEERKKNYIARHSVNEDWSDPVKAGTLSRYILWNKKTLEASIKDYKRRFRV